MVLLLCFETISSHSHFWYLVAGCRCRSPPPVDSGVSLMTSHESLTSSGGSANIPFPPSSATAPFEKVRRTFGSLTLQNQFDRSGKVPTQAASVVRVQTWTDLSFPLFHCLLTRKRLFGSKPSPHNHPNARSNPVNHLSGLTFRGALIHVSWEVFF